MTKTTNLEISKKLAEIGFKADYDFVWCEDQKTKKIVMLDCDYDCYDYTDYNEIAPSYDLETLLDYINKLFLFNLDNVNYEKEFKFRFYYNKDNERGHFEENQKEGESLADTAGRLIIKLHQRGLIEFGGEDDK